MFATLLLLLNTVCKDSFGFQCDRSVDSTISADTRDHRLKLNVALGDVLSLELPERVKLRGDPALGNSAIFDVKVVADPLRILVWPKLPQGASETGAESVLGERSNLQIFLDSGVTLAVELRIGPAEKSVQQVRFRYPEREQESAFVRQQVAAETQRLEAEYQERRTVLEREIAKATRDRLARGMLVHAECETLRSRTMLDLIVLRAHRICRIGSDMLLEFSIQNRARDAFALDRMEIRPMDGDVVTAAQVTLDGQQFLSFDQTLRGVVAWPIEEELDGTTEWALGAVERAGQQRTVQIDDVGF